MLGSVTPTLSSLSPPLIIDPDVGVSGRDECTLGEVLGDGSQGMGLTTLVSGYITSDFLMFYPYQWWP